MKLSPWILAFAVVAASCTESGGVAVHSDTLRVARSIVERDLHARHFVERETSRFVAHAGAFEGSTSTRVRALAVTDPASGHTALSGLSAVSGLTVVAPASANGDFLVGPSNFARLRVSWTLDGAADAPGILQDGLVRYEDVFPATSRVVSEDGDAVEDMLVLKDQTAPRTFRWHATLPAGITGALPTAEGGLHLVDSLGKPKLAIEAPYAIDSAGKKFPAALTWNASTHEMRIAMQDASMQYPVILDPTFVSWAWASAGSIPPRSITPVAYDTKRGNAIFYAGYGAQTHDTWIFDGATWEPVQVVSPPPIGGGAFGYDPRTDRAYLYQGIPSKDLWMFDPQAKAWTQLNAAPNAPLLNGNFQYDAVRNRMIFFATAGPNAWNDVRSETWTYDGATNAWVQLTTNGTPPPRFGGALAYDPGRGGRVVLYGGTMPDYVREFADVWALDQTNTWTRLAAKDTSGVHAIRSIAYEAARDSLFFYGGYQPSDGVTELANKTWQFDLKTSTWSALATTGDPMRRGNNAIYTDVAHNQIVVFGGSAQEAGGAEQLSGDSFALRGTKWVPLVQVPQPRKRAIATYDSARSLTVLFGGEGAYVGGTRTLFNDTWEFAGQNWQRINTASSIAPRMGAASTYVKGLGVLVFGGRGSQGALNDVWAYNGTWTSVTTTGTIPSRRVRSAMAYNPISNQVILYGGSSTGADDNPYDNYFRPDMLRDTYLLDVATQVWRPGPTAPASLTARTGHGLMFDARDARTFLVGGNGDTTAFWALEPVAPSTDNPSGLKWTQVATSGARFEWDSALAFDPVRHIGLMFGGGDWSAPTHGIISDKTWGFDPPLTTTSVTDAASAWYPISATGAPPARTQASAAFDEKRRAMVMFGGASDRSADDADPAKFGILSETYQLFSLGDHCATNTDCAGTTFCVDGVCCGSQQCGSCETCASVQSPGSCFPVLNREDPDTCALKTGKSCGDDGACKPAISAECKRDQDCASGFCTDGVCCDSRCDGACLSCSSNVANAKGKCLAAVASEDATCKSCIRGQTVCSGNFECKSDGSSCLTTCSNVTDCVSGSACVGNRCVPVNDTQSGGGGCQSAPSAPRRAIWIALLAGIGLAARRRRRHLVKAARNIRAI